MNRFSEWLFARPSFLEGVTRALDLGGTLQEYNFASGDAESDWLALRADWLAIADDFHTALLDEAREAELNEDLLARAHAVLRPAEQFATSLPHAR